MERLVFWMMGTVLLLAATTPAQTAQEDQQQELARLRAENRMLAAHIERLNEEIARLKQAGTTSAPAVEKKPEPATTPAVAPTLTLDELARLAHQHNLEEKGETQAQIQKRREELLNGLLGRRLVMTATVLEVKKESRPDLGRDTYRVEFFHESARKTEYEQTMIYNTRPGVQRIGPTVKSSVPSEIVNLTAWLAEDIALKIRRGDRMRVEGDLGKIRIRADYGPIRAAQIEIEMKNARLETIGPR